MVQCEEKQLTVAVMPVVQEYSDVFPEELPGLPPAREIEFGLMLNTA